MFQSHVTKMVAWLTEFRSLKKFFAWIEKDKNNEYKFILGFNVFNAGLYLSAPISPWIFIIWGLVVPSLLFRSGPLSSIANIIAMVRDKTLNLTRYMMLIAFMMLFYICLFACFYMAFAEIGSGQDQLIEGAWDHFFFSVVTFTTLGYGNLVPLNTAGEVIAAIEVIVGYAIFAFLIGVASSIALNNDDTDEA